MANKVIEGLARNVEEAMAKLLNAVRQHEALQKDLVPKQPAEAAKADKKTEHSK